jgi:nucleoside-diphosphate-sugar epimerase
MERTALVIGATGGVGSETAVALLARGWTVRALHRRPEEAAKSAIDPRIQWVAGDAMDAASVIAAARGASVIVHGANPPGYRNWKGLALPMLDNTIAAARAVGARIVFPGTVYNFGPEVLPRVRETAEQRPRTRKGAIRVEMERRLGDSGVPVLIVRAGDFFGPRTRNSWFSQGIVTPGRRVRWLAYPAKPGVGHAWAYVPDLARTIAFLLDRAAELEVFAVFHFRGHWFERGIDLAEATRRAAAAPGAWIVPFPWFLTYLLAPFVETFREMIEMRWLWRQPLELVNDKLVAFLGEEPHTPLDVALGETLRGLGCTEEGHGDATARGGGKWRAADDASAIGAIRPSRSSLTR